MILADLFAVFYAVGKQGYSQSDTIFYQSLGHRSELQI